VFSDGEWVVEEDSSSEEDTMSLDEQLKAFVAPIAFGLAELKVKFEEIADAVAGESEPEPDPEPELAPEPEPEPAPEPEAEEEVEEETTEEEDENMEKELEAKVEEQAAELEDKVAEVTALSEKLAEAEAKLAEAEYADRLRQFSDELSEIETLPVKVEEVAPLMLEFANKVGEEEYKKLLEIMKAMGNAAEVGALGEIGSDSTDNDAVSRFDSAIRARMEEAGKSYGDAVEFVASTQPELYNAYDEATTKAMRQTQEDN
jgi:DNA repair exonuclease SbcCD ATPase subunit